MRLAGGEDIALITGSEIISSVGSVHRIPTRWSRVRIQLLAFSYSFPRGFSQLTVRLTVVHWREVPDANDLRSWRDLIRKKEKILERRF